MQSGWLDIYGPRREANANTRHGTLSGQRTLKLFGRPFAVAALAAAACGPKAEPEPPRAPSPAAPEVQAAPQPLVFGFKDPGPWKSYDGTKSVELPDLAAETWRVMVNQTEPMQKKNPWWQPLPARDTVELEMPPGSKFRCMVPPLDVKAKPNEYGSDLEAWMFKRSFLCSNDGFRTWSETQLQVRQSVKGKRKVVPDDAGILLRERGDDGVVRELYVLMRSDKEKTTPTYGPPQIIPGRKVDDDDE
jgi:hypothetical protein